MAVTVCSARLACGGTALPPARAAARVEVLPWDPGKADACACLRVEQGTVPEECSLGVRIPACPYAAQKDCFWERTEAQD